MGVPGAARASCSSRLPCLQRHTKWATVRHRATAVGTRHQRRACCYACFSSQGQTEARRLWLRACTSATGEPEVSCTLTIRARKEHLAVRRSLNGCSRSGTAEGAAVGVEHSVIAGHARGRLAAHTELTCRLAEVLEGARGVARREEACCSRVRHGPSLHRCAGHSARRLPCAPLHPEPRTSSSPRHASVTLMAIG